MSKSLRLSEKWFNRSLWLVALVFAGFLVSLGSSVVGDLPHVERQLQRDDFIDAGAVTPLRAAVETAKQAQTATQAKLDQASLLLGSTQKASASARETFANWIATRTATSLPSQDAELIARTRSLDALKAAEAEAQNSVDTQQHAALDLSQAMERDEAKITVLENAADQRLAVAMRQAELRVFGYRLALTLPLLGLAVYLFMRQRQSRWWPFVWGFIMFALFTFFVELVPYLPNYGGYVRSAVGIVVTIFVGRYAILALNGYLAQQRLAELQPNEVRRGELSYDTALSRLAKTVCPGCERPVDLKNAEVDFCPHCGIGLFDHCGTCAARKSAFARFCPSCGTPPHRDALPAGGDAPLALA